MGRALGAWWPGGLYLLQRFRRQERARTEATEPTKMAIGVEGGFVDDKWEVVKEYALLAVKGEPQRLDYPSPELPMLVSEVCEAIEQHQAA